MTATDLPSIDDELEGVLAGPDPDYDAEPTAPEDDEHAERLFVHLRRIRTELARHEHLAAQRMDVIRRWLAEQVGPLQDRAEWLEQSLGQYLRWRIDTGRPPLGKDGKPAKTLHLPSGTINATAQQPQWTYHDEPAALTWLTEHHPDTVRIPQPKPALDKAAIKRLLTVPDGDQVHPVTPDGEVVPGITVTRRGDRYQVTLDEAGES